MKFRTLFIFLFVLTANQARAQITWDTARDLSRHEGGYGKFKPSVKASVFYNGHIGVEVAHVRNNLSLIWLFNNTVARYYGLQWIANTNYRYGLPGASAGADIDFSFIHVGLGFNAQTDFKKLNFYFVPNVGLTWLGTIGIYYGFPILLTKKDFTGNNDYQIGIRYNFTKDLGKEFREGTVF